MPRRQGGVGRGGPSTGEAQEDSLRPRGLSAVALDLSTLSPALASSPHLFSQMAAWLAAPVE